MGILHHNVTSILNISWILTSVRIFLKGSLPREGFYSIFCWTISNWNNLWVLWNTKQCWQVFWVGKIIVIFYRNWIFSLRGLWIWCHSENLKFKQWSNQNAMTLKYSEYAIPCCSRIPCCNRIPCCCKIPCWFFLVADFDVRFLSEAINFEPDFVSN